MMSIRRAPWMLPFALLAGCATAPRRPPAASPSAAPAPAATSAAAPAPKPTTLAELAGKSPLPVVEHSDAQADGDLPDPPTNPAAPDSPPGSSQRYEAVSPEFLWQCANPPDNPLPQLPEAAKAALAATTKTVRYVVELYFEADGSPAGLLAQARAQRADADDAILGTLRRWRSCPGDRRVHTRLTLDYQLR
jgi:hypothetical protein